jgi:outer membrane protein TolC
MKQLEITGKWVFSLVVLVVMMSPAPVVSETVTLQEGLSRVMEAGWDVAIARQEALAAEQGAQSARARLRPQVRAYADHTWLQHRPEALLGSTPAPLSEDKILRYGVEAKWLLTDFGRSSAGVDAASASAAARQLGIDLARRKAALGFISAYVDLLEADRIVEVAADEVAQFEAHLKDAAALQEQGLVTRHDTLSVEVALADAQQRAISASDRTRVSKSRLNFLMVRDMAGEVIPADYVPLYSEIPEYTEVAGQAAANRVELSILQRQIDASKARLSSIEAEKYPAIFVGGGYGFEENPYRVHEDNFSAVVGLEWDLYTGGRKSSEAGRIREELTGLELNHKKLADEIKLQVLSAHQLLSGAVLREEVAGKARERAEENLRLQRARYEEGEASATDVTDAVTALSGARLNHSRAVYDRRRAEAALLDAVGADLATIYKTGEQS